MPAAAPDSDSKKLAAESGREEQSDPAASENMQQVWDQFADDAPVTATPERRSEQRTDTVEQARQPAAPRETALQATPSPVPETFEMQDADMLQRAEDMARQRAGTNKQAEPAARGGVSSFAPASAAASYELVICDDDERQDPEAWLACIDRIEIAGLPEAAAAERELLAEAFPDFEVPATTE